MNKKAEGNMVGVLLVTFVAIVVAIALFLAAAQQVGTATSTQAVNTTLSLVVNGTPQYLTNYKVLSGVTVYNSSAEAVTVGAGNYSVNNSLVYNGALAVAVTPTASAEFKGAWRVIATGEPLGYIDSGAGRSVAGIIVIFAALAIAVVAMTPVLRNGVLDLVR